MFRLIKLIDFWKYILNKLVRLGVIGMLLKHVCETLQRFPGDRCQGVSVKTSSSDIHTQKWSEVPGSRYEDRFTYMIEESRARVCDVVVISSPQWAEATRTVRLQPQVVSPSVSL